ncbi:class I SAM-dependent methyltransferase [Paenibacillus albus]|uniref:Methyltransferase domain-containing protein n=1 Tax=Paenibacillus albus TaxID=2495582 RepID=A0A3Q8X1V1_9BACL|nr:class I SAM-dependent methyltransferase [Paenibacillus albus]AZN38505.1 methyltransferase domain-containing protein [Paenibacillus albus]
MWKAGKHMFQTLCKSIEENAPIHSRTIFEEFNLLYGHPWEVTATSDITTYYSSLYGLVKNEKPKRILEIGTAFGMSAATFLKASSENLELFVSMDLGIYAQQYDLPWSNIEFAESKVHKWCEQNGVSKDKVLFFQANSQPETLGDNENFGNEVTKWYRIPHLLRALQGELFDIIFVDGKHTEDGLLNDMKTFWRFLKPGGLMICDDLHDPIEYEGAFSWTNDTWNSYHHFIQQFDNEIEESMIWNFPKVPPDTKFGLRPFGLVRKHQNVPVTPNLDFEMFDADSAQHINKARQDHLASLGLGLAYSSVLEVGSGVGWHTAFFERMSCSVLSTDARESNVNEHLRRYPYREVKVADLNVEGSHKAFGKFDIIYCYGTLYHLSNPSIGIKELANLCNKYLLIETCVSPVDNGEINLEAENKDNPNQSIDGTGCRPGRDWVIEELGKYFPYIYLSVSQPNDPDFPIDWPVTNGVKNARAIFVASREELSLQTLTPNLINNQSYLTPLFEE